MLFQRSKIKDCWDTVAQSGLWHRHPTSFFTLVFVAPLSLLISTKLHCAPSIQRQQVTAQDYRKNFTLCSGPHPKYHVVIAPEDKLRKTLFWRNEATYRIEDVPDGIPLYSGSHADGFGYFPGVPEIVGVSPSARHPYRIMFRDAKEHYPNEWALTRFGRRYYHIGWIPEYDVQRLAHHHRILFLPAPLSDREHRSLVQQKMLRAGARLRQISIPFERWPQARMMNMFDMKMGYSYWLYPENHHIKLDQHAWEKW